MDRQQRYLQKQQTINIILYSSIVFIIGGGLYAAGLYIQDAGTSVISSTLFKDIGLVFIGASAVTVLFGWVTKGESSTTTAYIINSALEKALQPTVNFLSKNSLKNFRYDCWLGEAHENIQEVYEGNYLNQVINISYKGEELEGDLRVIFAVGNSDGVLKDYFDDERYIVKHKLECKDQELNVMSEEVCTVNSLRINNEEIKIKSVKSLKVNGCEAKEYIYTTPRKFRQGPVTISINYLVLKWVPGDKRIYISKQVFDTMEDAEFRIQVSEKLSISNIITDTTEITSLSANPSYSSIIAKNAQGKHIGAGVLARCSLLKGSAIRFELQRI